MGFGAAKTHVALCVMFGDALRVLEADFARFETSNRVVRSTPDRPLPAALVRKVVRHRLAEIEAPTAPRPAAPRRRKARATAA